MPRLARDTAIVRYKSSILLFSFKPSLRGSDPYDIAAIEQRLLETKAPRTLRVAYAKLRARRATYGAPFTTV